MADNRDMTDAAAATDKTAVRRACGPRAAPRAAARDRTADAAAIAAPSWPASSAPSAGERARWRSYRSLPSEPPTEALVEALHARGVPVLVPVLLEDKDLDWCLLLPDGSTGPALGREAIAGAALVVAPALAVDASGAAAGPGRRQLRPGAATSRGRRPRGGGGRGRRAGARAPAGRGARRAGGRGRHPGPWPGPAAPGRRGLGPDCALSGAGRPVPGQLSERSGRAAASPARRRGPPSRWRATE